MIGLKRGSVKLAESDSQWHAIFKQEKELLNTSLHDSFIAIEHIGSTSIPGIKAKPIIDIEVGIKYIDDIRDVEKIAKVLQTLGYEWRKLNSHPKHHIFVKGSEEKRTHYLHLVEYEGENWKNDLLFRDYLKTHTKIAEEYEKLKESLASKFPENREEYTKGKKDFIVNLLKSLKNS